MQRLRTSGHCLHPDVPSWSPAVREVHVPLVTLLEASHHLWGELRPWAALGGQWQVVRVTQGTQGLGSFRAPASG